MNHFPLIDGITAYSPSDNIDDEEPYLLDPYSEDKEEHPFKHLKFTPPISGDDGFKFFGTVSGITEKGKKTFQICKLSRDDLNVSRQESQEDFCNRVLAYLNSSKYQQKIEDKFINGEFEHSAALLVVYKSILDKMGRGYKKLMKDQFS